MPLPPPSPRATRLPEHAALLGLATLVAAASLSLALPTAHAIYCDRLAPLGVLAALAATLIALCFRALATARTRSLLAATLLLAAISLFASARFIVRYHGACAGVQQQLLELKQHTRP
jgi:hypothetical protein